MHPSASLTFVESEFVWYHGTMVPWYLLDRMWVRAGETRGASLIRKARGRAPATTNGPGGSAAAHGVANPPAWPPRHGRRIRVMDSTRWATGTARVPPIGGRLF